MPGLSLGNLAATVNAGNVAFPRAAALQGVEKMRHNLGLGLAQGVLLPHPRPNPAWLAELGTTAERAGDLLSAALSASAMWAANAATVSPAPDTADGRCHLTVANLRTMAHRSHEWPATLEQLRLAFADDDHFAVHPPVPATFGDEGAANHMRMGAAPRRARHRDLRLRGERRPLPRPPASRSVAGDRPAARARPESRPVRPAIRASDRRRCLPQRRRRGRQRACPVRA